MAISDGQTQLSKAQALAASGLSTNVIDLTQAARDIGIGEPLCVCITVDVALAGTTPTFVAAIEVSAASGMGTPTVLGQTAQYSALAAGARIYLPIPPGIGALEFLAIQYTLGGTTPTITVTANVIPLRFAQADAYGASGINVQ